MLSLEEEKKVFEQKKALQFYLLGKDMKMCRSLHSTNLRITKLKKKLITKFRLNHHI